MNSVHFCSIFTARFARDTEGAEVIQYLFSVEGTENKYPSLQAKSSLITEPCLRLVGWTDISFSKNQTNKNQSPCSLRLAVNYYQVRMKFDF